MACLIKPARTVARVCKLLGDHRHAGGGPAAEAARRVERLGVVVGSLRVRTLGASIVACAARPFPRPVKTLRGVEVQCQDRRDLVTPARRRPPFERSTDLRMELSTPAVRKSLVR